MQMESDTQETGSAGSGFRTSAMEHATAQATMQPWIQMECFQLSHGKWLARLDSLDLGDRQAVRERQMAAVQKLGATPPNLCTISYCTPDPTFRFSDHCASNDNAIFFMPESTEFDLYVPAGAETAYVSLDQDRFLQGARTLDPVQWESAPNGVRQLRTTRKALFREAIDLWFDTARLAEARGETLDADVMRDILMQTVLHVACAALRGDETAVPHGERMRALRICSTARVFAEERSDADDPPSVVDICRETGVSERTLQYAFRSYVGMSPTAYLRLLRLNRARAMLKRLDPRETSVTTVAMRFGFLHLGRFSQDYKRTFGETPSATLAS